ncbi:MAG: hypothetical protein MJB57_04500 [Gemmatimonadetes bacterium]|nr:hypothetical protein [Gemmatimonadota bacterium]
MRSHRVRLRSAAFLVFSTAACTVTGASIDHGSSIPPGISGGLTDDPTFFTPDLEEPEERGETTVATVMGELYSLVSAQREYRSKNGTYARGLSALEDVVDYQRPSDVTVRLFRATESGYSAISRKGRTECAVFIGLADPPRDYVSQEGVVDCNERVPPLHPARR